MNFNIITSFLNTIKCNVASILGYTQPINDKLDELKDLVGGISAENPSMLRVLNAVQTAIPIEDTSSTNYFIANTDTTYVLTNMIVKFGTITSPTGTIILSISYDGTPALENIEVSISSLKYQNIILTDLAIVPGDTTVSIEVTTAAGSSTGNITVDLVGYTL